MNKHKMSLPRGDDPKEEPQYVTAHRIEGLGPILSFKYLDKCQVSCFKTLHKKANKNKNGKYFDQLQAFFYDFDKENSLEDAIRKFTSSKGSKIRKNNKFVNRIITTFKTNYPDEKGLINDNLIHIHLKRGGLGKFVIFGAQYENVFYVLAFDPEHEFDKD